jgi:flagellar FliL protein
MAEEEQVEGEETSGAKSKLKPMLLALVGVLIVAGASVGATLFFLGGSPSQMAEESMSTEGGEGIEGVEGVDGMEEDARPLNYLAMKPPFVVNYNEAGRTRFLQLELSLVSRDGVAIDTANTHMPLLRNNILQTLALQNFEQMKSVEGKEQLVASLTATVQATIEEKLGRPGFETVLFRSFVMQ